MPFKNCRDRVCPCFGFTVGLIIIPVVPVYCCIEVFDNNNTDPCTPELSIGWPTCLFCPSLIIAVRNCYRGKVEWHTIRGYAAIGSTCCLIHCYSDHLHVKDNDGTTALHVAVSDIYVYDTQNYNNQLTVFCWQPSDQSRQKTVAYLLSKGADTTAENNNGQTPYEVMNVSYVLPEDLVKLKEGQAIVEKRRAEAKASAEKEAEQNQLQAEEEARLKAKRQAEQRLAEEERRIADEEKRIEEEEKRDRRVDEFAIYIKLMETFLLNMGIHKSRAGRQAECLVVDYNIQNQERLREAFLEHGLVKEFELIPISVVDQKKYATCLTSPAAMTSGSNKVAPMPMEAIVSAPQQPVKTDCFLTHDWGVDELGRNNHTRVAKVNDYLKNKGLETWFDADRMEGSVRRKMTEGIDNTQCMIVFVTNRYRNKVNGADDRDNCRYEFTYAVEQKGPQNMAPVVMEPSMLNAREWKQELGAALASKLFVGLVSDEEEEFAAQCEQIYLRIKSIIGTTQP